MRKNLAISVLLVLVPLLAIAEDTLKERMFSAKVADVRLSGKLSTQGKRLNSIVSVSVPARVFDEPLVIADVRQAKEIKVPEIDRFIDYQKALIGGSADEILAFWHPDERQDKSKIIKDEKNLTAVRNYYSKNPGLKIVGIIYQEKSSSVLVSMHGRVVGHSFRKKDENLYLSDKPTDDLELAIVEASFVKSSPAKKD